PRSTARRRNPGRRSRQGSCRWCGNDRWGRNRSGRTGAPERRDARAARRAARGRSGDGAEDLGLPPEARRLQLARGAGRDSRDRAGPHRTTSRRGGAVRRLLRARPHLLAACLCLGLAGANLPRLPARAVVLAALALVAVCVARPGPWSFPALGVALALAGWWWGSARLDALDRSPLQPRVGTAERALVAVTGPARRSPFDVRVPGQMRRFGDQDIREPVLLRLPPRRSPPQGAILDLIGEIRLPRGPKNGFDERTWLRRHGVHVVVRADRWRIVGRRGGLAGFADRLRTQLSAGMAPGPPGGRGPGVAGRGVGGGGGVS